MLKFWRGFLLVTVSSLGLVACSTHGVTEESVNFPLTAVDSAVESAMSMGVDHYSDNHREFYSRPFLVKQDAAMMKSGLRQRGLAKVTVLGETLPYEIEVEVTIEKSFVKRPQNELKDSDYAFDHYDKRLAIRLLNSIIGILNKREKTNNLIDDFRSF